MRVVDSVLLGIHSVHISHKDTFDDSSACLDLVYKNLLEPNASHTHRFTAVWLEEKRTK
ncbi:hypothetical protein VIBNIMADA3020_810013 [Vibrio nigripulchritudo MADA3020]|nr:hypothetical protein VIBNIMADA3020_810013 [Vibrio nigripulchritudo MADA3020]CCN56492.1 hypothetical protein VIBNIMADA3021_950103 [Vibrio nigripulchritudo MADA3021]